MRAGSSSSASPWKNVWKRQRGKNRGRSCPRNRTRPRGGEGLRRDSRPGGHAGPEDPRIGGVFGHPDQDNKEERKEGDRLMRQVTVWSRFVTVRVRPPGPFAWREYTCVVKKPLQPDGPFPLILREEKGKPVKDAEPGEEVE
jgi:hypothetical protein